MVDNLIIAEGLEEALKQKTKNSAFLAGGTEINRLGSTVQARKLISIGRIGELDGISDADNAVKIGAMCTFQDIIDSSLVPDYLKEACRFMGSRTKRNMATIGGNIALRRTDSYLYATLIACGAKLELLGKDGETETRCVCCYLHHHDNFKDMDLHLPVGCGSIDWEATIRQLVMYYDGTITLEVFSRNRDYVLFSRDRLLRLLGRA